ncbi:RagB/SusD family nutrient uptake outer membrane protein [Pseudoflavitalea rhizosphaerae]|uniref:RagB/SusD family nutrient uptake outer membrane protein n=1 Tax=Pseudoflavitalea rhizosphaerae TaxID=1884793 RepID=UPI000F8EE625|nr:RagB/SusD family nutrient uptake outer membrane protein [Pseudoflavitalea rhizosphaerae]
MQLIAKYLIASTVLVGFYSCDKYLEKKALKSEFIPNTIEDLQALLDNPSVNKADPALLEIFSDEYYVTSKYWESTTPDLSSNYVWSSNAVPHNNSWNIVYQQPVYVANIVLDNLSGSSLDQDIRYNEIKGAALFLRSNAFFNLAQIFALPYTTSNQSSFGVVLRTTSDINQISKRASLLETYERILTDLTEAATLLPHSSSLPTRPSKNAAYAALARVYLTMSDYKNAFKYADLCLKSNFSLLDFNEIIPGTPIQSFNKEVIFHSAITSASILSASNAKIDTILLSSYLPNDLRRTVFFRPNSGQNTGTFAFRGSYNGTENSSSVFTGTTYAEMLLIRAECFARNGEIESAIADINSLLEKRFHKDYWMPIDPASVTDPVELVLSERQKELVFRGIRWMDLRRLNSEGANITIRRIINDTEYKLLPNDRRMLALIPFDVINRSEIVQNVK